MTASSAVILAIAAIPWFTASHPNRALLGVLLILGSIMALVGLRTLVRSTPVLAADETGLFVSITGSDRSFLPWEVVGGADVVGTHGNGNLVILSNDVEMALRHVHPALRREILSLNRKHLRPGAVYIMDRVLGKPASVVAGKIRELLGEADATEMLVRQGPKAEAIKA